jgi:cellulase
MLTAVLVAAALAGSAAAHGGVTSYKIAGTTYPGWSPYNGNSQTSIERPYSSYDPITSVSAGVSTSIAWPLTLDYRSLTYAIL